MYALLYISEWLRGPQTSRSRGNLPSTFLPFPLKGPESLALASNTKSVITSLVQTLAARLLAARCESDSVRLLCSLRADGNDECDGDAADHADYEVRRQALQQHISLMLFVLKTGVARAASVLTCTANRHLHQLHISACSLTTLS